MADTEFKIKFDGEQNHIDANILINNLIHTTSIVQEINNELNSGKRIEIKIKALEKGSFLIHIDLVETALGELRNLLTKENIEVAGIIITSLVGLIQIKKFLKGKKPKNKTEIDGKVNIENQNGDVIVIENFVNHIYETNVTVNEALSQSFESLENDNSITKYEIIDKNNRPLIKVEKEEFEYLSLKSEEIIDNEKIIITSAKLNIIRASFEENLKWEFYYKGNKISAKLKDPSFNERIDKGEPFAKGDILEVELEIKQTFNETVNTFINKSYKVNKIVNHIKRDEQQKLEFE